MLSFFRKKKEIEKIDALSINETVFTVVDTELTGLNEMRDTIIAIGCIKMKGGSIKLGEVFYRTVRPEASVKKDSIKVHEITPAELESCPYITPILREYLSFTKDSIIVGHCLSIDLAFLRKAIKKYLNEIYKPLAIDTFNIYKWLIEKGVLPAEFEKNNSLKDIAVSLEITPRELHDAMADAFITAQIFQRLIVLLGEVKIFTLGQLLNLGNPDIARYMGTIKKETYQF